MLQASKTHPSPHRNTMLLKDGTTSKNMLPRGLTSLLESGLVKTKRVQLLGLLLLLLTSLLDSGKSQSELSCWACCCCCLQMSYSLARPPLRLPGSADIYIHIHMHMIVYYICLHVQSIPIAHRNICSYYSMCIDFVKQS